MEHALNRVRSERSSHACLPTYTGNDHHYPLSFVLSDSNKQLLEKMATEFDGQVLNWCLDSFQILDWLPTCVSLYLILLDLARNSSKITECHRMVLFKWLCSWRITGNSLMFK